MKILRLVSLSLLAACLAVPTGVVTGEAASAPPPPTLVAVRAAHHPGFDRIVYQFKGGLPSIHRVHYVDRLVGDSSGLPVRIAGRAILRVRFSPARANDAGGATAPARKAFALPNIMDTVQAGDFEGVTSYGIGLAKKTTFHVFTLRSPSRVVIDVRAGFPTVARKVFFFNEKHFVNNNPPFFSSMLRPVRPGAPAVEVMDRLFAGPLSGERADGLVLLRSHATGFTGLSIANGVARVRLIGGCNSDGSTVTVAGEIMPTLRQFDTVNWVKIYDPAGDTEDPTGHTDSIPTCLEP
jgi:hypothetical protein